MLLDPSTIILGGDINSLLNDKVDVLKKCIYNRVIPLPMRIAV